jgi:hypothetical protein
MTIGDHVQLNEYPEGCGGDYCCCTLGFHIHCPVCDRATTATYSWEIDEGHGAPEPGDTLTCRKCRSVFAFVERIDPDDEWSDGVWEYRGKEQP